MPDRLNCQFYVKDMHTKFTGQSERWKKIVLYASISFHACTDALSCTLAWETKWFTLLWRASWVSSLFAMAWSRHCCIDIWQSCRVVTKSVPNILSRE